MTADRFWTLAGGAFCEGGSVPVTDRGFRYGMSVFETLAIRQGRPLFADGHLSRLRKACAAAEFDFPDLLPSAFEALPWSDVDGMCRLYVTAGDGNLREPPGGGRAYCLFEPAVFPPAGEAMRMAVSRSPFACVLGGWKTGNYWPHIQALAAARKEGCGETAVFNAQGNLLSAACANVFLILDGILRTPPTELGARDGVVRAWVMENAAVECSPLAMEDLARADQCFLTSSRVGVMPVSEIDGRILSARTMGLNLAARYREEFLCS